MYGKPITEEEVQTMINLRAEGHSLPEIMKLTKRGSSTVFKYVKSVAISEKGSSLLKIKQGGSRKRSENEGLKAKKKAVYLLNDSNNHHLYLLAGLYWGEGNKKELNLINSDPLMIKVFMNSLRILGVEKSDFKINLRLYEDMNKKETIDFWESYLNLDPGTVKGIELVKGSEEGKLRYGMCRVRVAKSGPYFKLIKHLIQEIAERSIT